jgi:RimJ/RimL family protein N-acetyltransferase
MRLMVVTYKDIDFLWDLLKERTNDPTVNISHLKLPHYMTHSAFVKQHPYQCWYIIKWGNRKVGSIYLTKQNEIGIFIMKRHQGKHLAKNAIALLVHEQPLEYYIANINPQNERSIGMFTGMGFRHIQQTYRIDRREMMKMYWDIDYIKRRFKSPETDI